MWRHCNHKHLTEDEIFKKPSSKTWFPQKNKKNTVERIIEAKNNDIDPELKKLKWPKYSNLSEREQKAPEELKLRDGTVITNAHKGGAVAILDVKDYLKECERQLYNTENHKHLQKDPIATNNELVHIVIKRFENEKVNSEIYRRTQKKPSTNSSILHKT